MTTNAQKTALSELAGLGAYVWYDLAPHLTCTEAEVFADFVEAYDLASREDFLEAHEAEDEEGDAHYIPVTP